MATARRAYRSYRFTRPAWLVPSAGLPAWGWDQLGRPLTVPGAHAAWFAAAGLAAMVLAGLAVIPGVYVSLVAFAPDLPKALVPRPWRASYRNRRKHARLPWLRQSRDQQKSSYRSDRLKRLVLAADGHRCVGCGAPGTDVDHRIPWAWGGLTVLWNCFTLCANCNQVIKVDYWEDISGRPHWGSHFSTANRYIAHRIFRRESRRRWNPFRMLRIAWALGT
jgi:5-methylcytosine-specific restriction endonuclease McrA